MVNRNQVDFQLIVIQKAYGQRKCLIIICGYGLSAFRSDISTTRMAKAGCVTALASRQFIPTHFQIFSNFTAQQLLYMQLAPSAGLSHIVKHYLILTSEEDMHYRLFSDGNPGLVFHFKNPMIQYGYNHTTETLQPKSFIYGQMSRYNDLRASGALGMMVVVLRPYGIYTLLQVTASEMNDRITPLAEIFGPRALELQDRISNADNVFHMINIVEEFLLKKTVQIKDTDPVFKESLQLIFQYKGTLTIEKLLRKIPVTERQLERKYNKYIGTGPKKFSDIIKFQHFLKQLQSCQPNEKMTAAAYDGGYYDQSHLNNYFKKTTGITPRQYKLDHRRLALNFMERSRNV